ncbi:hypothetical protein [Thalassotalea sp. PP2-459]|uniref:hypothetical protein n=1 Tax=Thalassotalea sp. PP2-459 TaxID=1742724 RepID=UPI000944E10D|nr:hypothetical protein [Thalassotalea sp. PP2-459]OKY27105.1 hypothetical protein BI291_10155 [Thalassotalea sp. PP2-459]
MNNAPFPFDLKTINAKKKQLAWGDVPPIYQLTSNALSELESILTHGFESAYRQILDRNSWNLSLLKASQNEKGDIVVKHKPKIALQHVYTKHDYELHCFPVMNGEKLAVSLHKHPRCPFIHWVPETMQMLFRINAIVSFIIFSYKKGDEADLALIRFAHNKTMELIDILTESFEVVDVIGYNIAQFCQEIGHRSQVEK